MSYIKVGRGEYYERIDGTTFEQEGASRVFETDSESLAAASEILNLLDGLDNQTALLITKVVF